MGRIRINTADRFCTETGPNTWAAHYVNYDDKKHRDKLYPLAPPSQGWDAAWQMLLDHKLLSLPDGDSIKCNPMVEDGFSYVVEIKKGKNYRTYMYATPDYAVADHMCSEAAEILAINTIIIKDYGAK